MKKILAAMHAQFEKMVATNHLFTADVLGDALWAAYLNGFTTKPIYRSLDSNIYNCNYCHSFIKQFGNIVALDEDYNLMTLWDFDIDEEYAASVAAMRNLVRNAEIQNILMIDRSFLDNPRIQIVYGVQKYTSGKIRVGCKSNTKVYTQEDADLWPSSGIKKGDHATFEHFYLDIPAQYSKSDAARIKSDVKNHYAVSLRGMEEISLDTLELVRDLELQGSLLNGASYRHLVLEAIKHKKEWLSIAPDKRKNWAWIASLQWAGAAFRNTAIGTLMVDLTEGMEINAACRAFNKKVDPANYMKATAPITKKQIAEAQKFVEDNGYEESFQRRCATLEDIKVSDILHSNADAANTNTKISIFDNIKSTSTQHKKAEFKNVEEVSIEKFMRDILPTCTSVEVMFTKKLENNLVSLITSENKESKPIFKWNNNFSWTYNGNLTGKSEIKHAVKQAGGFVDAPFRFSIMWNEDGRSIVDFDAHIDEPFDRIYYGRHNIQQQMDYIEYMQSMSGGVIDIDMIRPKDTGIENIFYQDLSTIEDGRYNCYIDNYDHGRNTGVKAEIYCDGQTWTFEVPHKVDEYVDIATVTFKNNKLVKIEPSKYLVDSSAASETIWGLNTNEFHKANLICLSPNFWGDNGIGNKHYFFMLEGCQNPETQIRTFHNEFLNEELRKHRKVMEVLSAQVTCDSAKKQLSGIGFNATVHDEVILRLGGSHKRVIKVKF